MSRFNNVHYLVDAGSLQGSKIDPGERLIAPALGRLGIDHLDGVILTHNHQDHTSSLAYIIEHYPVERFYLAASISELNPALHLALRRHRVHFAKVDAGWSCIERDNRLGSASTYRTRRRRILMNDPLPSMRDILTRQPC